MLEPRYVSFPTANLEVEIVLSITLHWCRSSADATGYVCILLCESVKRLHGNDKAACQEICLKTFARIHVASLSGIVAALNIHFDVLRYATFERAE